MNLDSVTVALRPRSEWESVDLGARMVRRDAATIYAVWFALTLPLAILATLVIFLTPYGGWAFLVYWWLEPITDGPILHVISRKLFGETTSWTAALRMTPQLARRNWIFLLTPWRAHFARSIAIPVTQLEGLSGDARRRRAKVLNRRIFNYGTGVTVAYQHLVLAIYFGVMLLAVAFVPPAFQESIGLDWLHLAFGEDEEATGIFISFLLMYIAQSALHPWWVGAGFGLYINCRTRLEAWDIEVAFRRMLQRRAGQAAATAVLVVALCLPPVMTPAGAQEEPLTDEVSEEETIIGYWTDDEVAPALENVMARDALSQWTDETIWTRRTPREPQDIPDDDTGSSVFGESVALFIALVVEFAFWIIVGGIVLIVALTAKRWLPLLDFGGRQQAPVAERIILADGELTAESLPADVPRAALELWQRGEKRRALSLLFRGGVLTAVTRYGVRLPDSATENDCLDAVRAQSDSSYAAYFARLVRAWSQCAYGTTPPRDDEFNALCAEWQGPAGANT